MPRSGQRGHLAVRRLCVSLFRSPRRIRRSSPHSLPEVNQAAIARSERGLLKSATCSMRRKRDIAPTRRLGGKVGSASAARQAARRPRRRNGRGRTDTRAGCCRRCWPRPGPRPRRGPGRASLSCKYLHDKSRRWRSFDPPTGADRASSDGLSGPSGGQFWVVISGDCGSR
jgi:hypothetical protein